MGKKGSNKKVVNATSGSQRSVTIREASTGKIQTNAKSLLKLQHIKNLAVWASVDASIPSLGAFFGHHLATSSEALGTSVDSSLFTCQRCESILQPGFNCTIRIEKNKTNARRKGKKPTNYPQNNIVYTCHFCSHRNIKRGTPKGHMKEISPPEVKSHPKSTPFGQQPHQKSTPTSSKVQPHPKSTPFGLQPHQKSTPTSSKVQPHPKSTPFGIQPHQKSTPTRSSIVGAIADEPATSTRGEVCNVENGEMSKVNSSSLTKNDSALSSPLTPSLTLLESKKRKRNRSGAKKTVNSESYSGGVNSEKAVNTSNRRRRKSWTTLKEIAENENSKRFVNLTIPFSI